MKTYGTSLFSRWLRIVGVVGACCLGQVLAHASAKNSLGTYCLATNEGSTLTIYWRLTFTINPEQVTPPDNVIIRSGSFANNQPGIPLTFDSVELGEANGTVTCEWRTNTTDAYTPTEPSSQAIGVTMNWDIGPDTCNLYTPPYYCIRPRVCNDGLYTRQYRFFRVSSAAFSSALSISPPLLPGNCHTFGELCSDDKNNLQIAFSDFEETADGWTRTGGGTNYGGSMSGWTTNTATTGATSTNSFSTPTPTFNANNTNNQGIIYRTNGAASTEGTLASGFDALYKATVDGFEKTHNILGQGFHGTSNAIIAGNAINSAGFAGLSNGLRGLSNAIGGLDYERNTNNIYGIRQNTSNTVDLLRSVTNLLAGSLTNAMGETNAGSQGALGAAAAVSGSDEITAWATKLPTSSPAVSPTDIGDWTMSIGSITADFNPLQGVFGSMAVLIRKVALWILTLAYAGTIIKITSDHIRSATSAPQAKSAAVVPGASTGIALGMAAAITVAIGLIPAFLTVALNAANLGVLFDNPLSSASAPVNRGIALANAFWPVDETLFYALAGTTYYIGIGIVYWVATTTTRFLVGCIVIWCSLAAFDASARDVEVKVSNHSGVRQYFYIYYYTTAMVIEPGDTWTAYSPVDDEVGEFSYNPVLANLAQSYEPLNFLTDPDLGGVHIVIDANSYYAYTVKTPAQWFWDGLVWGLLPVGFGITVIVVRGIRNQTSEV